MNRENVNEKKKCFVCLIRLDCCDRRLKRRIGFCEKKFNHVVICNTRNLYKRLFVLNIYILTIYSAESDDSKQQARHTKDTIHKKAYNI